MNRLFAISVVLGCSCAVAQSAPTSSFVKGTAADEAQIRAILKDAAADEPNSHVAADLDWENAFGIRYTNLAKRNAFYHAYVTPLQKDDTDTTLEVKVQFLADGTAIADEYWHVVGQLDVSTRKPGPDRWGRTTYIFVKQNGAWTEVLERIADLRLPYYKHFEQMPVAVPLPAATLASYAGSYVPESKKWNLTLTVSGDHLVWTTKRGTLIAIPVSETSFLVFDPADLAEYQKLTFSRAADGTVTAHIVTAFDDFAETLVKQP